MTAPCDLESFFAVFRKDIIGRGQTFTSPFGKKEIIYADWTASGRAYQPIEAGLQNDILPYWANSHTASTITGAVMTNAYEAAKAVVKAHVHANEEDVLLFCGSGMTSAVNKLQRILGLRIPERVMDYVEKGCEFTKINEENRPIVFVTHMEHHSNQTSWLETIATVEIINADKNGQVDLVHFASLLEQFKHRKNKIAAVTAGSNVTGIQTPYHEIAKMIHEYNGWCFVDFACPAPYVHMDMHPKEHGTHLDAIYFSMHKFLGGPGTPGILIFDENIYRNAIPDQPGGGTTLYSNPWKKHEYITNIELREDGGTPPLLQGIKAAMCIRLKEEMGVENMLRREEELLRLIFERLSKIENIEVLAGNVKKRLGVVSFIVKGAHHHAIVKMLNDRFGIQMRGGCSCAGTYGHQLLQVDKKRSYEILHSIRAGNMLAKPGWIRLSIHPTMTNTEIDFILDAIEQTAIHFREWMEDYTYEAEADEYIFTGIALKEQHPV